MAYTSTNGKVAIPKLDRGPPPLPKVPLNQSREDRVTRACKNCRKRKVRCSGEVPRCTNCQSNKLDCFYEQARRDRLREAIDLNKNFVALFKDLGPQLNERDRKRIQDVIDNAEDDMIDSIPAASSLKLLGKRSRKPSTSRSPNEDNNTKKYGEARVTASVGSNEDLDYLDEDLLRSRESRQTGYVGQVSKVQWLRSVQQQSQNQEGEPFGLPYGPPGSSEHSADQRSEALHQRRRECGFASIRHVTDATFYLDSDSIELDIVINPYELPDPEIAEQLLNCYMETVHGSFPIVPPSFEDQVHRFTSSVRQNRPFQVPDRWRAILNLVFAIGAKYSHMIGTERRGRDRDHLTYMTRASQLLSLNDNVALTSSPDITLVQATAVFSLYFLVIGHVSRAWLTIGVSIRTAMSLGLHLRNEVPATDSSKKEMLAWTWWGLHSIECLVCSITGRPPIIQMEDSTVPFPKVYNRGLSPVSKRRSSSSSKPKSSEASSRTSSSISADEYFISSLHVALLTQKVLSSLYAPRTAIYSWQDIQGKIKSLLKELADWYTRTLEGTSAPGDSNHEQVERERMLLQMHYWSIKILISRPCLCRTERRIKNQSDASADFNNETAKTCVASARALTALFPDIPDLKFVYTKAPWWNVVHIIMQCAGVLLLEVGYQNQHSKDKISEITFDVQKLIAWLRAMGQNDLCADRAHTVLQRILTDVAPFLQSKAHESLTGKAGRESDDAQAHNPFISSVTRQNATHHWDQGEFFNGLGSATGHPHILPSSNHDHQDTVHPANDYIPYDNNALADLCRPNMFGNPFVNSWDEAMPLIELQSVWPNGQSFIPSGSENTGDMYLHPTLTMDQGQGDNQSRHQHLE
ncbi:hypothetical protein OPT61_g4047 [Boeremia exigua]|uniref:Uncharacterized protein n=1 Tax=Boeremia exigua TaxID=749465 RepID=A0ACC2IFK3_9PLEO|nr:hypothetical protein OPT61_g4047 [Boeremia exigua]